MSASLAAQKEEHKLTLRAIMSELGTEYLRLTNALLIDDFKGLEESRLGYRAGDFHVLWRYWPTP
jgi:hypothetical protein